MKKNFLFDWKIHLIALILVVVSEFIGVIPITLGPVKFSLLPMLYALVFGIILGAAKLVDSKSMKLASGYISMVTTWLIVQVAAGTGPNVKAIFESGPAIILQEFGNLGTLFIAVPVGVLIFSMGRQAIGAGFSNSREPSIAIVGNMFGLDSQEGQGVMGAYITGTLIGTIFCGLLASLCVSLKLFHPYALGLAAGTGSGSMMAAALAPVVEAYPDMADQISAYAGMSQMLTYVDGTYMSVLLAIPLSQWLYNKIGGPKRYEASQARLAAKHGEITVDEEKRKRELELAKETLKVEKQTKREIWATRLKVVIISGIMADIANVISTLKAGKPVSFVQALPGLAMMFIVIMLGCLIDDYLRAHTKIKLPNIVYMSLLGLIFSLPIIPFGAYFNEQTRLIGLLPLCTPILAFAGISAAKDMKEFRSQGIGIVITAMAAFVGTYLGSATIANVVLKLQGII